MNDRSQESTGQKVRVGALRTLAHKTLSLPEAMLRTLVGPATISADGMVLDLHVQTILWLMARAKVPELHELSPELARKEMDRTAPILAPEPAGPVTTLDRTIDTAAGPMSVRVYRPSGDEHARGVLVFFHGGGWVLGSIHSHDAVCAVLASRADCVVVSVEYRLAPDHKFPHAADDAVAAFRTIASSLTSFGGDGVRVAVGGDSAGGNLSAIVAQECRNDAIAPRLQLLIYPATDMTRSLPSHEFFREGFMLSKPVMDYYIDHYLASPDQQRDPRASPLFADDVKGVAPAFILTAGFDPLRDEGRAYAEKLEAAGVATRYRCYEGMVHGFVSMSGAIPAAEEALQDMDSALREAFSRPV